MPKMPTRPIWRQILVLGTVVALVVLGLVVFGSSGNKNGTMTYTSVVKLASSGQLRSVKIQDTQGTVETTSGDVYLVTLPTDTSSLSNALVTNGVEVTYQNSAFSSAWFQILLSLLPIILIVAVIVYFIRRSQAGNMAGDFGKSRARMRSSALQTVTFSDVAGCDEAKQELGEIVQFLRWPERFFALKAKIPKGVLLFGPPGCGKTMLAKAVAGEAKVPFFSISGSEFVEMFVGVGASRVRDLFEQAKKNSPCIVFVDEIDAVGRQRGTGLGGGHDEREQTLNQLLVEMDGFETDTRVIVMAATNRPDILDPALMRPGRFDRHVTLDRPDVKGRRQILDVHAREMPFEEGVNLDIIARRTPGFSGADLANLINEAAILAARANQKQISMAELEEATNRVIAGPERKSRHISEAEKKIIAYHETGHALVMRALPMCDPVHKISIVSRGMALGWTLALPEEDRHLISDLQIKDQLAGILGGRCAEELIFKSVTSGAENDIQRATEMARRMVTQWGMSPKVGIVALGHKEEAVFLGRDWSEQKVYSDESANLVDTEIRRIIDEAHTQALSVLRENLRALDLVSSRLIEVETMDSEEFERVLAQAEFKAVA